jgi:hypothetical protein
MTLKIAVFTRSGAMRGLRPRKTHDAPLLMAGVAGDVFNRSAPTRGLDDESGTQTHGRDELRIGPPRLQRV